MTAWGFALFIIGAITEYILAPPTHTVDWRDTGGVMVLVGLVLLFIGITEFLWEHMP